MRCQVRFKKNSYMKKNIAHQSFDYVHTTISFIIRFTTVVKSSKVLTVFKELRLRFLLERYSIVRTRVLILVVYKIYIIKVYQARY